MKQSFQNLQYLQDTSHFKAMRGNMKLVWPKYLALKGSHQATQFLIKLRPCHAVMLQQHMQGVLRK